MVRIAGALSALVLFVAPALAQTDPAGKARSPFTKPARTFAIDGPVKTYVVVKFKDGLQLQTRSLPPTKLVDKPLQSLEQSVRSLSSQNRSLQEQQGLTSGSIDVGMQRFNQAIRQAGVKDVGRLFSSPEPLLTDSRALAERTAGVTLAHLTNYYRIGLPPDATAAAAAGLADELNRLDVVEIAYIAPLPEDAQADAPTPDYSALQGYLGAAPAGVDAPYAWKYRGGRGEGVIFADIEQGWLLDHEDLPKFSFKDGKLGKSSFDHGTAVLGEIVARDNGRGMTGIANHAKFGVVSASRPTDDNQPYYNVADAINVAAQKLQAGDVMLIEQHARGPGDNTGCTCNCSQYRFVPMEFFSAEFDAIKAATAKGIIVVEAGGNGGQNLDDPMYGGDFDRSKRDSGAIMVGASNPNDRTAACFSNYGSRIDVHAWGGQVASTGYGDIDHSQQNPKRQYTKAFGGTSSASPIVTGVVAALQGIRKANTLGALPPAQMRELLAATGTPFAGSRPIGPLPDLRKAIDTTMGGMLSSAALAR